MALDELATHALVSAREALKKPRGTLTYMEHGPALPSCVKCRSYVDRLTWDTDPYRRERIYVAHCHGEKEVVSVTEEMLYANENTMRMGDAFTGGGPVLRLAEENERPALLVPVTRKHDA